MSLTLITTLTLGLLQTAPAQPVRTQPTTVQPASTPAPMSPAPTSSPAPASAPVAPTSPAPVSQPVVAAPPVPAPYPAPAPATAPPATNEPPASWYVSGAPPTATMPAVRESAADTAALEAVKYRRLVFSNFYTLNQGIWLVPSGELSVFLGTNLRPRRSTLGPDWNTAIGYQMTLSLGEADIWYGDSQVVQDRLDTDFDGFARDPIFYHRHALMAQGYGGRKSRLFYALGGGAVMWNSLLLGIEAEGKLGYIFSAREGSRVKGVLGGQLRLGGPFDGFPLPQFGFFIGFMVF